MLTSLIARQSKIFANKKLASQFVQPLNRNFGTSVYLWRVNPRLGPKGGNIKTSIGMKKGIPERVEFFDDLNVKSLKIGMKHSAVISGDGGLYMFGGGNWGVLGQGIESDISYKAPQRVNKFDKLGLKVVDVALGEQHSMALTDDGSVWTWGYGGKEGFFNWMYSQEVGALGHGDKERHFVPKKVNYFQENNIKVKSISAGLYHCNVVTDKNELYTWGRGLYGVLGNGSNAPELSPMLNEDVKIINDEDPSNPIVRFETADEFNVIQQKDGTLHAWGKNDKGQMGTQVGIGMDMIECESVPTLVELQDENGQFVAAKDFYMGQNTCIITDLSNNVYLVGLKLQYTPKLMNFDKSIIDTDKIDLIACGRKHYVLTTKDNQIMVWGNIFKEKSETYSEGFHVYNQDALFDDGTIKDLEVRYGVFGALVEH